MEGFSSTSTFVAPPRYKSPQAEEEERPDMFIQLPWDRTHRILEAYITRRIVTIGQVTNINDGRILLCPIDCSVHFCSADCMLLKLPEGFKLMSLLPVHISIILVVGAIKYYVDVSRQNEVKFEDIKPKMKVYPAISVHNYTIFNNKDIALKTQEHFIEFSRRSKPNPPRPQI